MPSPRFRLLGPVLLIAAVAGLGLYWNLRHDASPIDDTSDSSGDSIRLPTAAPDDDHQGSDQRPARFAQRVPPTVSANSIDDSGLPPMPNADVPLAEAMDDLLARAEAGEPEATCRLLLDVSACTEHANRIQQRNSLTERAAGTDSVLMRERMIDFLAANDEATAQWDSFCKDSTPIPFAEMERLLFQALPNMSNRQRLLFTMSREDGSLIRLPRTFDGGPPRTVSGGILSQYHADNDLDALEQGIAEADPLALEGMLLLYMPMSFAKKMFDLREALPDPYRFAGYALMMQQLYGPDSLGDAVGMTLNLALAQMPPTTRNTLQLQVDSEVSRWRQTSVANPKSLPRRDDQRSGSLCGD